MEVSRLPLSATQRGKLIAAGHTTLSSLSSISSSQLAGDLNISDSEASEILNAVSSTYIPPAQTSTPAAGSPSIFDSSQNAWDLLQEESQMTRITTSCFDLDDILGGGLCCREVTEIGGVPGIGKTQIGIQLAINVQIPSHLGGLGGKAVYIDTEGSFMVERVLQMAEACLQDLKEYNQFLHNDSSSSNQELTREGMLDNIYFFRVCSYTEQIALVNYLEIFLSEHKDVRIVIFDSITFHFRQDFDNMALRTRVLTGMSLKLMKIARKFNLAVVMLNQVTMKYIEGSFQLALALGDSWSHCCTNRIILYWNGDQRFAYIDKSPSLKSETASYCITGGGIRNSPSTSKRIRLM